ncbi:MAG: site-specific integrase [Nostoc sp. DedQUE04]|uniref:site-specific integrase n=1 Tax=Nostoc sp. DedQUE04 TaxID=3075390 RepID=UPI002AD1FA64|nr:site-specific integrase [Nostoc sp. DedQUE04]MDZ8138681.1 site-specific integrase [Nostoc sp. DedQUE04]
MRDININPIDNNGSIQLKFSFSGKRYSFNPIPGGDYKNKRDFKTAQAIATRIENDILADNFDKTLDRYRLIPKAPKVEYLVDLWDLWVDFLGLPERTLANHYRYVRQMIAKVNPKVLDTKWVKQWDLSPRTHRDRLGMIRACCNWGVAKGYLDANPYYGIKPPRKVAKEIQPFNNEEIKKILEGFDSLCPHYGPFVRFLLATGVRTSEAIGLQWKHIDFTRNEIVIKESLSKDLLGNGYTRIRKETKTGNIRYLNMSEGLRGLLLSLKKPGDTPDTLVFTAPRGGTIDADNFRERCWLKVLEAQGISYRQPYTTRHTMASHAIEQHISLTGLAYLLGHTDTTMVMKTYGHMINRPDLPDIPI